MKSGVYRISIGALFYFGSSKDIHKRKQAHILSLKKGSHGNIIMQRAFNKYQIFSLEVVVLCAECELIDNEQRLIDEHKENRNCMNISTNAANAFHCRKVREVCIRSNKERVWTTEMRKKLGDSLRGRKCSAELKQRFSDARQGHKNANARLSEEDAQSVFMSRRAGETIKSLSERFGVHRTTITRACAKEGVFYKPKKWSPSLRAAQADATLRNPDRYKRLNFTGSGELNPRSILTQNDVCEIKIQLSNGARNVDLGRMYGVNPATIYAIKSGRIWKTIDAALIAEYSRRMKL